MEYFKITGESQWDYIKYDLTELLEKDKLKKELEKESADEHSLILKYNKDVIDKLPEQKYGIYPIHLKNGVAVEMTEKELKPYKVKYEAEKTAIEIEAIIESRNTEIKFSTFDFDGHFFNMNIDSQALYNDIGTATALGLVDKDGFELVTGDFDTYQLTPNNIKAFLAAYSQRKSEIIRKYNKQMAKLKPIKLSKAINVTNK